MPETAAAFYGCEEIHDAEGQDAFDWARDDAQREDVRVVLVPSLDVEGEHGAEEREDGGPGLSEVRCACENEDFEGRVARVDACRGYTSDKAIRWIKCFGATHHGQRAHPEVHSGAFSVCRYHQRFILLKARRIRTPARRPQHQTSDTRTARSPSSRIPTADNLYPASDYSKAASGS